LAKFAAEYRDGLHGHHRNVATVQTNTHDGSSVQTEFFSSFVVSPVLRHYGLRLPVLPVSACELQALASEGSRAPSYHY
jgi:hypothetical protein